MQLLAGVGGLHDADHIMVYRSLANIRQCRAEPGCEEKIRRMPSALAFCLENRTLWLAVVEEVGYTTQGIAAQVLCGLFGRDEDGSEFTFTQEHIDMLFTSGLSP